MLYSKVEYIHVVIMFISVFDIHVESIQWKITTKPVVIGNDAILACSGYNCTSNKTRKWLGGKNYDLLCFDHQSKNISKYEMRSYGTDFELIIKSFSFSDLNCEYTCACGFSQYTNMLQLDEEELIYPPVVHDHSRKHSPEDLKFQINVSMQVYPLPTCTIVSKDSVLLTNVSVVRRPGRKLMVYEVLVQTTIETDIILCDENLTLDCEVGSIQYQHVLKEPYSCKDDREQSNPQYFLMARIILSLLLILVVVLAVILLKKRLGETHVTNQRYMDSDRYSVVREENKTILL